MEQIFVDIWLPGAHFNEAFALPLNFSSFVKYQRTQEARGHESSRRGPKTEIG